VREVVRRNVRVRARKPNLWNRWDRTRYLFLSIVVLILSACFPAVERQLIVLSLITGAKWIMADGTSKINILIKQGGDDDGRVHL
jgi:hypothetical protein